MFIIFVDVVGSMFSMCFYPVCCLLILPTCDACSLYRCFLSCSHVVVITLTSLPLLLSILHWYSHLLYTYLIPTFLHSPVCCILYHLSIYFLSLLYAYYYSITYFFPNDIPWYTQTHISILSTHASLHCIIVIPVSFTSYLVVCLHSFVSLRVSMFM